jgi:hypothetical protein
VGIGAAFPQDWFPLEEVSSALGQGEESLWPETDSEQERVAEPSEQVLRAPSDADRWPGFVPPERPSPASGTLVAQSYHFDGLVRASPDPTSRVVGVIRRGARASVARRAYGRGCASGAWFEVTPYGYVCTTDGFLVSADPRDPGELDDHPDTTQPLPFQYAEVKTPEALRFARLPTPAEAEAAERARSENGGVLPDVVFDELKGIYYLALRNPERDAPTGFYKTVTGRWIRASDVALVKMPQMQGEILEDGDALPLAFVFGEDRPLMARRGEELVQAGTAEKHARFNVASTFEQDGREYVAGPDGVVLDRAHVRVVGPVARPEEVPRDAKWMHVNLAQQTLTAYEGDRPVFATLISSGKEGYEPDPGLFRIHEKYLSKTMNGSDPIDGYYEVEEVPWTMYYWESYALHGAYWHDDFGQVRSHGCTNIAPRDARWLFYWSEPQVPAGWQGTRRQKLTWVYFTA